MILLEQLKNANIPLSFINEAAVKENPTEADLIRAINNREYVMIYYVPEEEGDVGARLIEPYCLGRGYKVGDKISNTDQVYLRAFVIRNPKKDTTKFPKYRKSVSHSQRDPYFRLFLLKNIQTWMPTGKKFSNYREGYNPSDSNFIEILASLPLESFPKGSTPLK